MAVTLNDTLGVKRDIKHYDFGMPFWDATKQKKLVIQFEAFGFCKPGEGMAFVRDTDLSYQGTLPMNTGGGQISAGQAACSSHNLIEAVRQLMGEAGQRQVKDTANALVTGIGWINYGRNWGSSAALALVPNQ